MKTKVLTSLTSKLAHTDRYLGDGGANKTVVLSSSLKEGVNQGKVLLAAVTASIPSKEKVP